MQYISNLTKEQQRQLSRELQRNIVYCTETACMIADKYNVDRNEAIDLYMYLQKKYCNKHDLNKIDLKTVKLAQQIAMKLLKRGAE